jgi:hypothetical protein
MGLQRTNRNQQNVFLSQRFTLISSGTFCATCLKGVPASQVRVYDGDEPNSCDQLKEFSKKLKKLLKRYRTRYEDLEVVKLGLNHEPGALRRLATAWMASV